MVIESEIDDHGFNPKPQSALILETEGGEWLKPAVLKPEIAGSLSDTKSK
jgi:hypothetical protein